MADTPGMLIVTGASRGIGAAVALAAADAGYAVAVNIRVNAVSPGLIETDIHSAAGEPDRLQQMAPTSQ